MGQSAAGGGAPSAVAAKSVRPAESAPARARGAFVRLGIADVPPGRSRFLSPRSVLVGRREWYAGGTRQSHLLEARDVGAAHRHHVGMVLQMDQRAAEHVALDLLDGTQVDDSGSMNLRELLRVE